MIQPEKRENSNSKIVAKNLLKKFIRDYCLMIKKLKKFQVIYQF